MARSRARKIADLISGNTFDDGVISASEVVGLGSAATLASTAFATAAQGTLGASALQPTGDGSGLSGILTPTGDGSGLSGISGSATAIVTHAAAPAVGVEGTVYYNTTINVLFISNGSTWQEVVPQAPNTTGGTVSLSELTYGSSYTYGLGTDFHDAVTTDANLTYVLASGTLPSGLAINGVNLEWNGVSPVTGATYNFTIRATDGDGLTATQQYSQVQAGIPANTVNGSVLYYEGQSGTWTVPANVYSIAVVAIGGGGGGAQYNDGGGGGALAYKNNISVTPNQTFTYASAAITTQGSHGGNHSKTGGDSTFTGTGVTLVAGGGKSVGSTDNRAGGIPTGHDGGGNGGQGGYGGNHAFGPSYSGGGGGGAGGYSGNGGNGGWAWPSGAAAGAAGSGGGGGGGGGSFDSASGGFVWGPNHGGNVGLEGEGSSGSGGVGSGNGAYPPNPSTYPGPGTNGSATGTTYGGGGAGSGYYQNASNQGLIGRGGAVRIVYKVSAFSFPSTNVG